MKLNTTEFLSYFKNTWFQTFDDTGSRKTMTRSFSGYDEAFLKKANKENYGVYFSANGFLKSRSTENIENLNAIYCDMDVAKKGDGQTPTQIIDKKKYIFKKIIETDAPPHIIILTKNGIQPIWFIDEEVFVENINRYKTTINGIIDWSKKNGSLGDRVNDITRVLRIPGYNHCKDPENPFLIEAIRTNTSEKKYKFAELNKVFKPDEKTVENYEEKYLKTAIDGNFVEPGDPGEGGRNIEASKYIGALLKMVEPRAWEISVWKPVVFWNSKLENPLSEKELRMVYESICRKESRNSFLNIIPDQFKTDFKTKLIEQLEQEKEPTFKSGYEKVDEIIGGFRYRNNYLVSGIEKSGKSSFLMKILQNKLDNKEGDRVGFLNTELSEAEFARRMAAFHFNKNKDSLTDKEIIFWYTKYGNLFDYAGIGDLAGGEKRVMDCIEKFLKNGITCLVLDNITTFALNSGNKTGWENNQELLSKIFATTKQNKLVTFIVAHANSQGLIHTQKPNINGSYDEDPAFIFQKKNSYVSRPTLSSIYGGGQIKSQISGSILIWRPHQKTSNVENSKMTNVILESFRHSPDGDVSMSFDGAKGIFTETEFDIRKTFKTK